MHRAGLETDLEIANVMKNEKIQLWTYIIDKNYRHEETKGQVVRIENKDDNVLVYDIDDGQACFIKVMSFE